MSKVSEAWYFGNREYLSEEVEKNALDFEKLIDPRLWEEDDEAAFCMTWLTLRRLPPRRRSLRSKEDIHRPIQTTGWGQPSGSPISRSSRKLTSAAAIFH